MMVSSLRPKYLAVLDTNIMIQCISEKHCSDDNSKYCGIKVNVISLMNDPGADLSPKTFLMTASKNESYIIIQEIHAFKV